MQISHSSTLRSLPPPWNYLLPIFSRLLVWLSLGLVVYILRSFFLTIFLTFVFSYIQGRGVDRLSSWFPNRSLRVVLVSLTFLGVLIAIGGFVVPRVRDQATLFTNNFSTYVEAIDKEIYSLAAQYPVFETLLPPQNTPTKGELGASPAMQILRQIAGVENSDSVESNVSQALEKVREIGAGLLQIGSAFFLALLLSFLILLDLPRLSQSVRSIKDTKLGFVYDEVAESIVNFCQVLGRALEAQFYIALINTALTAIGVYFLGLTSQLALILVVVFLCGFVPVAGVFLSSVPICLLALQSGGLGLMLFAALMIWVIHMLEAYVLNPKIYGHRLKLNAVIVLIILTVAGKLFHVWGLVLGLPICTYVFGHAIQTTKSSERTE